MPAPVDVARTLLSIRKREMNFSRWKSGGACEHRHTRRLRTWAALARRSASAADRVRSRGHSSAEGFNGRATKTHPIAFQRVGIMTQNERDEAERQGLILALAVVERYQRMNERRLRVSDICIDIKRLINAEVVRLTEDDRQPA